MARERWFYAQGSQRRGPLPFNQVVESILAQPEPQNALVWRKGFADWTRAEDVPEVERRLAPFLARREAEQAARRPAPTPPPAPSIPAPSREVARQQAEGSPLLVYGGIAAGVVLLALLAWLFWPRGQAVAPPAPVPLGGTTAENAPAVVIPAKPAPPTPAPVAATPTPAPVATPTPRPTPTLAAPGAVADKEADLPPALVKKLKGVAAWAGDTLTLTVYNGTPWRVTELYVRIGRFVGDDFVEDPRPIVMTPPGGRVDAGVADLLSQVAPDRKRPGLNPLDTGPFSGKAGQQPESFRFEIESARGYAPR